MTTRLVPARRHTRHRHLAGAIVALVVAVVALLVPASAASAHAELESTSPSDGSTVATSPTQIQLTFTERVEASLGAIKLLSASGRTIEVGPAHHVDGKPATIAALVPHLDDGTYVVTWRAISSDSHPVFGSFTFRVGNGPTIDTRAVRADALAGSHASGSVAFGLGVTRWLVFAASATALGALAFLAFLWPAGVDDPRMRRLGLASLALIAVASIVAIAFQGAYADAGGLGEVVRPSLWRAIVDTRFGRAALVRSALAVGLAVTIGRRPRLLTRRPWLIGTALAGAGVLVTIAISGHATTGVHPVAGLVLDLGHLAAMCGWIGGLVALATAIASAHTTLDDVRSLGRRFSPVGLASVGVLAVTGSLQSWRQLGDRAGLSTAYGRLLLWKLALVALVVLAAWVSRRTVRAWKRGAERPDPWAFRRTLVAELVLIGAVLVATSALVATQPGRDTAGGPVTVEIADRDTRMTLTIDPARHGTAAFHLYVSTPGGALQQAQSVTLQLSLPDKEIDRLDVPLDPAGPNHFTTETGRVPFAGRWTVTVKVLLTEFDERTFTTTIRFR